MNPMNIRQLFLSVLLLPMVARATEVRFAIFDLGLPTGEFTLRKTGGDPSRDSRVEWHANNLSAPVKLEAGEHAVMKPDGSVAVRLAIDEKDPARLLLVPFPGPDRLRLLRLPDPRTALKPGQRMFLNAADSEIRILLGNKPIALAAGGTAIGEPGGVEDAESRFPVRMMIRAEGEWKTFNSTFWFHDPRMRSLVLVVPEAGATYPRVRSLTVPPEPAPEEP